MSFIELLLTVVMVALLIWTLQLKQRVRLLEEQNDARPPEPNVLTTADLQKLQNLMVELVQEMETYSESQLRKIRIQAEAIQALCERVEQKVQEVESPPIPLPEQPNSTRVVPLSPKQIYSNHKDRDRIIDLHKRGWEADDIARELRIPRGEVQLIVNLS